MRRNGRKGDHLATDDYYGFTEYASRLIRDYWGSYSILPFKRNPQEMAFPLNDPRPVDLYRGPSYEVVNSATTRVVPTFVGNTTVRTNLKSAAYQAGAVT